MLHNLLIYSKNIWRRTFDQSVIRDEKILSLNDKKCFKAKYPNNSYKKQNLSTVLNA